jgi:ubiquinone/menaquinone biosynthesis C-methylase UbiE
MSGLSEDMLKRLDPPQRGKCLDLTCGTGFVTQKLFEMTSGDVTGVDASEQMITVAQKKYGDRCHFLTMDAFDFLRNQPSDYYDCVTCAWGFGYLPSKILHEMYRTLRHQGRLGIIDNSILSNWEFVTFFLMALAEKPQALTSLLQPRFHLTTGTLSYKMRMNGFHITDSWKGQKMFPFEKKETAMERLMRSGVTAGIIQMIEHDQAENIVTRTGELLQKHHLVTGYIPITHRYIGVIGEKK